MPSLNPSVRDSTHELVVSCDPGPALRQLFEQQRPEFIAIHDVATHSSRKLLAGIAAAAKGPVQKLAIRRQGYGNTLATLSFVELPTALGPTVRVYSTDAEADEPAREAVARALLAFSTLGVLFVGEAPAASISGILRPLREDMIAGPWPNRHLLLLPLVVGVLVVLHVLLVRRRGVVPPLDLPDASPREPSTEVQP